MAGPDWQSAHRNVAATNRILDSAAALFTRQDAASVGMNEFARAAGCSRATLYRYFESREALYNAFVQREAIRLYQRLTVLVAGIEDPAERLLAGMTNILRLVRESPPLSAWFASNNSPIGVQVTERSEFIQTLIAGFLQSLGADDCAATRNRRAHLIMRILTSLLIFPGRDDEDERTLLDEYILPMVRPSKPDERIKPDQRIKNVRA